MSQEIIVKVREAEESAERIVDDAKKQSADRIAAAKAKALDNQKAVASLCNDISRSAKEEADLACAEIDREKTAEARSMAKKIISSAEGKMDSAVGLVITEIFNKWQ